MANPTDHQKSLTGATWIDVNTNFTRDPLPDRLPDTLSISNSSLRNLFNCPIGARGKIFQPEYGSLWHYFLQEPIDDTTATSMRIAMIQAIARWEPRITLDYSKTFIKAVPQLPGYQVRIAGIDTLTGEPLDIQFTEQL